MAPGRPRIVVVHSSDELYGADRILLQVLAALDEHVDADVEVWLPDDVGHGPFPLCETLTTHGYRWRHGPVPVLRQAYRSPFGLLRLARSSWWVGRELRAARPDLVHLSSSACLLVAPVARLAGVARRSVHVQERWTGSAGRVLRLLARATTLRIAISEYVVAATRLGDPAPVVIPNCVDDAAERVEDEPGRGDTGLRVVVASRWNRWKGHRTLLRAWALAERPGHLVVLGGPPIVGEGVDVAALVDELVGRTDTIDIVGEVSDVAPYLAAADVLVLPSDEPEPFGLVTIEAFSLGRPVVASRAGGPLEIIDHGRTGWLFEPGDAAELATLLSEITPAMAAEAGVAARAVYDERFDPGQYRRRIADVIANHLGEANPPTA